MNTWSRSWTAGGSYISSAAVSPKMPTASFCAWLAARLARTDLASLLADCRRLPEDAVPQQRAVSLLRDVLEKSAHVLLVAPEQLAAQLLGRLPLGLGGELDTLIEQTKQVLCTWPLQPCTQNLQPVGSALLRTLRGYLGSVNGALALPDGRLLSG
jgi:hypothetical protein